VLSIADKSALSNTFRKILGKSIVQPKLEAIIPELCWLIVGKP